MIGGLLDKVKGILGENNWLSIKTWIKMRDS